MQPIASHFVAAVVVALAAAAPVVVVLVVFALAVPARAAADVLVAAPDAVLAVALVVWEEPGAVLVVAEVPTASAEAVKLSAGAARRRLQRWAGWQRIHSEPRRIVQLRRSR